MAEPREREVSVVRLLDSWPWPLGGCLIGGYAVAAYGRPRYSQDLDLVVPTATSSAISEWLAGAGFVAPRRKAQGGPRRFPDAERFENGEVSVDLMRGHVQDRGTRVSVPEGVLSDGARRLRLELVTGSTEGLVSVCRPEALWVLKLVAARDQDLSDLFAIADEPVDLAEVWRLLERFQTPGLIERLRGLPARLQTKKIFRDSLTARSLPTRGVPDLDRRWARFVVRLQPLGTPDRFPFRVV